MNAEGILTEEVGDRRVRLPWPRDRAAELVHAVTWRFATPRALWPPARTDFDRTIDAVALTAIRVFGAENFLPRRVAISKALAAAGVRLRPGGY